MREMVIVVVVVWCSVWCGASGVPCARDPNRPGRPIPDPYCGIYSLYAAMRLNGHSVEMTDLVKPEFMGSKWGSSIEDLKRAAEDQGLCAVAVEHMTGRELRRSGYRVVLGLKSDAELSNYDHYELFLGTEQGKARLFNPPGEVRTLGFRELAAQWDGVGLIVSGEPSDVKGFSESSYPAFILYAGTGGVIILVVCLARRRAGRSGKDGCGGSD